MSEPAPHRRDAIIAIVATLVTGVAASASAPPYLSTSLAEVEAASGGRLGVAVHDLATGRRYEHRATERFPMCSTFKLLAAAAVLSRTDAGLERLDRVVRFSRDDLVDYSPVTEKRVAEGMTLAEICEAAITQSDNTAGNLLLASLGGPGGVTAYARAIGDTVTRLDRTETSLNEATPGDVRDTTTPVAMAANLHALVLGRALSSPSRALLGQWLVGNRTGDSRLRAGLPSTWRVGDKTGAGEHGTTNDVAVVWRPRAKPLIISAFLTGADRPSDARNATMAAIARAVAVALPG